MFSNSKKKLFLTSKVLGLLFLMPITSWAADESGHLKNPVVLSHGFNSSSETFYALDIALNSVGVDDVEKTDVPPLASSYARGEVLVSEIEEFLAITGKSKVNIIAHSQGGLDARYVAAVRPDLVASVTTLASPHFGVSTADLISKATTPHTTFLSNLIDGFLGLFGQSGVDTTGSIESLTSEGAARFNAITSQGLRSGSCRSAPWRIRRLSWWRFELYKDYSVNDGEHTSNGIKFMSLAGKTEQWNFRVDDPLDWALTATSLSFGLNEDHDGLVGRCSTHFGDVIRDDYVLNHNDFVNATRGMRGWGTNDPVAIMKQQARRMKSKGL